MAVIIGSPDAILSGAVGGNGGVTDPLPDSTEGLTRGHWSGLSSDVFPPPPGGGEGAGPGNQLPIHPLYPIIPERKNNKILFRTDKKNWVNTQKSATTWSHEAITIQYRIVEASYMNTFYAFIESHKGQLVELSTPGYQPFLRADESNLVYILKVTEPVRVKPKTYEVSVTFLFNPN